MRKIFFILAISLSSKLVAATWNLDANGNWNVNGNWAPAVFPNSFTDTAVFPAIITAARVVTLGQNIQINLVSFNEAQVYTIQDLVGNFLTFGGITPSINILAGNTGAHIISSPIQLDVGTTVSHVAAGNFTLSGVISGVGGLTKVGAGAGVVILSNANSYAGPTSVTAGTLRYSANGAIPAGNATSISGGTLNINAVMTPANAFTLSQTGGTLLVSSNMTVELLSLSGTAGTVQLSAAAGNLNLFDILETTSTTYAGSFTTGNGNASSDPAIGNRIIKNGATTLTLTGASTHVSRLFIADGIINAQSNTALGAASGGANTRNVFIEGGATLELQNSIAVDKRILLNGNGFLNDGALHNVGGSNTVSNQVTIGWSGGTQAATNASIQVDPATTLTLSNAVQGANELTIFGGGTLVYTTGVANTLTGKTILNEGTLQLSKTAGTNAIAGDVEINGGTLQLINANQIINTANVVMNGGTFDTSTFGEIFRSFIFNGGTLIQVGPLSNLGLNAPAPLIALSMRDVTITGNVLIISGGVIHFDNTNNGTANLCSLAPSILDLGGATIEFNIDEGTGSPDMLINGHLQNGGVLKTGAGTLEFSGTVANTYTGTTTVSAGELILSKTAGVNAIAGTVITVNGGELTLNASNQIIDTATMTLSSGAFNMQGNSEEFASLIFNGGTYSQSAGGTLTLNSTTSPLIMRDTTLNGSVLLNGAGVNVTVFFVPTNNGTAIIDGSLNLGGGTRIFNIGNGSADIDMQIGAVISNGGLTKIGTGTLYLTGANTYAGGSTVNNGILQGNSTSLQGAFTLNTPGVLAFQQDVDGTFTGTFTGTGSMIKQGSAALTLTTVNNLTGPATVAEGTLIVNNTLGGAGALTVASGGTLSGVGPVNKNTTVNGTLAPATGIGTMNMTGTETMASGSTLAIELNPTTSDLVNITGTYNVQPGSTLALFPAIAAYNPSFTYTIVQTTAGRTGTFSSVTNPFPLFAANVIYNPLTIQLQLSILPFIDFFGRGNTRGLAECLDALAPTATGDLSFVITTLRTSTSLEEIEDALLQIQPSQLTSVAIAEENNLLYVKNALYNRLEGVPCCDCREGCYDLWATVFTGFNAQKNIKQEPGFNSVSPGFFIGVDTFIKQHIYLGLGTGYTHTYLDWKQSRGKANLDTVYVSLYGAIQGDYGYLEGALTGGYDWIKTNRDIQFSSIKRTARSSHRGIEGSWHLKGALLFNAANTTFSPYASADMLFIHEDTFKEKGAGSLDLKIMSTNANMLVSEVGLDISRCVWVCDTELTPYFQVGVIRESRWKGDHETAFIEGCGFTVKGLNPSRTLGTVGVGLNTFVNCRGSFLSLYYKGRYGRGFQDNAIYLQFVY